MFEMRTDMDYWVWNMDMTLDTFGKGTLFNETFTQKDDIAMAEN